MSFNSGFQLALELSNVFPVQEVIQSIFTQGLAYARSLGQTGSDFFVEENLTALFGRGRINPELEAKFKDAVKVHGTNKLCDDGPSDIVLDYGQGPTVNLAMRDQRHLSTIIQLTMLAYFHARAGLAEAITEVMSKRIEMGLQGSEMGIRADKIMGTLAACSAQASAFDWSRYSQQVHECLRSSVPGFCYSQEYIRLSASTLLAMVDVLYLVQSLPSDRRVSISSQTGCIVIVVWAHFILKLNVTISLPHGEPIVFGNAKQPQVWITWRDTGNPMQPTVKLQEKNLEVVFDYGSVTPLRSITAVEERHPLAGLGTEYLRRLLQIKRLVSNSHPIYLKLNTCIISLALISSKRLFRDRKTPIKCHFAEAWNIVDAGQLIFEGMPLDLPKVTEIVQAFDEKNKQSRALYLEPILDEVWAIAGHYIEAEEAIYELATITLAFAHVPNIKTCASMPVLISLSFPRLSGSIYHAIKHPHPQHGIKHDAIFGAIAASIMDPDMLDGADYSLLGGEKFKMSLGSDFGWSLFYTTAGDRDPADVRPETVLVQRGTPKRVDSGATKHFIRDGTELVTRMHPTSLVLQGDARRPSSAAASIDGRTNYWVTGYSDFSHSVYYSIKPSREWTHEPDPESFEDSYGYCELHESLWRSETTSACGHDARPSDEGCSAQIGALNLQSDTVLVLGWRFASRIWPSQRVMVLLTYGQPKLRRIAVVGAWDSMFSRHPNSNRRVMIRTRDCCLQCALSQLEDPSQDWILIL